MKTNLAPLGTVSRSIKIFRDSVKSNFFTQTWAVFIVVEFRRVLGDGNDSDLSNEISADGLVE